MEFLGTGTGSLARLREAYRPQLATLVGEAPDGDEWLHEVKFDGYRIGAALDGGRVALVSRNGNDWTARLPELAEALARLPARRALVDGEAAMLGPDGRTDFQALQNAFGGGSRAGLVYFAFDLLHLDGQDLAERPLEARKEALRKLLRGAQGTRLRFSDHWVGHGPLVRREACRLGLEGVVSKRRDRAWRAGRHGDWVKAKCLQRQELVVGGFTDPEHGSGLGALLVGFYEGDSLRFAGKVGTGFTHASSVALRRRLEALRGECPFEPRPPGWLGRSAHWARPELVAEVAFTEWTRDGSIRHPSYQGLREDKDPREVRRESPAITDESERPAAPVVAGVRISHPDRIVYADAGVTKLDVVRYYEAIAERMVPHLRGRPLTLVQCPQGVEAGCRFLKHAGERLPAEARRVRIREKTKVGEYLIVDDAASLVRLAQHGILEFHTWNSRADALEEPDRVVLDLDPGPQSTWRQVVAAARLLRAALEALGLRSFVKTTGGKGLHVVVPIAPALRWERCLAFSRALAERVVATDPSLYTTAFAKRGREAKILVDYLRNNRTNTSVAAYSLRARPGAPVSVPLSWDEVGPRAPGFTLKTLPRRLRALRADPWADYERTAQALTPDVLRALGL